MVLARWTGETVLRYIREAPLAHLADEVNALEGKRNLLALSDKLADGAEKLTGKVQDLEDQLRLQRERRQATSLAASAEDPDRSGRPYVTNGAKKATKLKGAPGPDIGPRHAPYELAHRLRLPLRV
jgi:hypothetical protein